MTPKQGSKVIKTQWVTGCGIISNIKNRKEVPQTRKRELLAYNLRPHKLNYTWMRS